MRKTAYGLVFFGLCLVALSFILSPVENLLLEVRLAFLFIGIAGCVLGIILFGVSFLPPDIFKRREKDKSDDEDWY